MQMKCKIKDCGGYVDLGHNSEGRGYLTLAGKTIHCEGCIRDYFVDRVEVYPAAKNMKEIIVEGTFLDGTDKTPYPSRFSHKFFLGIPEEVKIVDGIEDFGLDEEGCACNAPPYMPPCGYCTRPMEKDECTCDFNLILRSGCQCGGE